MDHSIQNYNQMNLNSPLEFDSSFQKRDDENTDASFEDSLKEKSRRSMDEHEGLFDDFDDVQVSVEVQMPEGPISFRCKKNTLYVRSIDEHKIKSIARVLKY